MCRMLGRGTPFWLESARLSALLPADLWIYLAKSWLYRSITTRNTAEHLVNLKGNVSDVQPALCHSVCR